MIQHYWNERFRTQGQIWGTDPSP
ncbi:MAG: hypothetical protein K0Q90_2259, partial [Paenibacillaceae bacterium]|nr:hypothetical protein [Paenibacillaceae bacterium]